MADDRRPRRLRFIPAPAGNTRRRSNAGACASVHPRACGEHMESLVQGGGNAGSSPRLRGTRPRVLRDDQRYRFIPAPAGNTSGRPSRRNGSTVHPRACGEHAQACSRRNFIAGSSPRLRGTRLARRAEEVVRRFIPAPAGNTRSPRPKPPRRAVHPRACGEHISSMRRPNASRGSSPRLRGTRRMRVPVEISWRFIPAPAGNTRFKTLKHLLPTVHPRACGEHLYRRHAPRRANGSSPRLRGTLRCGELGGGEVRFIPAPAGNTSSYRSCSSASTVHPRACGEHPPSRSASAMMIGSSPRLRGTPRRAELPPSRRRFIPAPAGNTRRR